MPALPNSYRFDPVMPLHKAVRHFMFEVLTQVGALDASDIFEVDLCAKQVTRLARLLPDTAVLLGPLLAALHQRDADGRAAAADALYQELTRIVGAQLASQLQIESEGTPLLQVQRTDLELRVVRRQQLSVMSEQELADALRSMAHALTPQELASFIDDLQTSVDALTFSCLLDTLRRQMTEGRWQRLARELGMPETGTSAGQRPTTRATGSADTPRRAYRADRYRLRAQ